jgi:hypothetical protein
VIPILSALWPFFALSSDRESDEEVPLRTLIATWLQLEDYESIVKTLLFSMKEPFILDQDRGGVSSSDNFMWLWWNEENDPACSFIEWYITSSFAKDPVDYRRPRWLKRDQKWLQDWPGIQEMIKVYNDFQEDKKKTLEMGNSSSGHYTFCMTRPIVFSGHTINIGGKRILAPGWASNGEPECRGIWPIFPPHLGEHWFMFVDRKKLYIYKICSGKWKYIYHTYRDLDKKYCRDNGLFIIRTSPPSSIVSGNPRKEARLIPNFLLKVISLLGKMSDAQISRMYPDFSPSYIATMRKDNDIPAFHKEKP